MIPQAFITEWREFAPWSEAHQVEQDLVLSRALIEIYSDPHLRDAFAFRGGTAMQKLHFKTPTRYSEDIDLVQVRKENIGPSIDAFRKLLDPWLGKPKRFRKPDRVTLIYRFQSEVEPTVPMRLKVEINNGEHFTVFDLKRKKFNVRSSWYSGEAQLLTYEIEEMLGTKLRALYQRKKGRDLYDMAMALTHFKKLDTAKVVDCFRRYMAHEDVSISRAQYEANLSEKMSDKTFLNDIAALLTPNSPDFNAKIAAIHIQENFLTLLPGEPWKGLTKKAKKKHI